MSSERKLFMEFWCSDEARQTDKENTVRSCGMIKE